jgi:AbrB family looped-hinge helix DNA binding protein
METVTISPKFQVVIPKLIRNTLRISPGEKIVMYEKDGIIYMVRIGKIKALKGKLKKLNTVNLRDEDERFAQ